MAYKITIAVKPIFSLFDRRLENILSPQVLEYRDIIEESLSKYSEMSRRKRLLSIDRPDFGIRNLPVIFSTPLENIIPNLKEEEIVSTPFLLGLATHQKLLMPLQHMQSIEVFEKEQLFLGKFNRPSQLCLRRGKSKWLIDTSTYVYNGLLNAGQRESPNSINTLRFIEEKVSVVGKPPEEDFSNKIIG